jgi:arginine decarboxylase
MAPTEEFHAYPGHQLMAALREHARPMTRTPLQTLSRRITRALLTARFAKMPVTGTRTTMAKGRPRSRCIRPDAHGRPSTLFRGADRHQRASLAVGGASHAEWRRLRRPLDAFIYEPVIVGSCRGRILRRATQHRVGRRRDP